MSSLKEKFEDYRETPQHATWQQLLGRLNAEMPVKKKRRYLLWLLPLFITGTSAAWWFFEHQATTTPMVATPSIEAPASNANNSKVSNTVAMPLATSSEATISNTVPSGSVVSQPPVASQAIVAAPITPAPVVPAISTPVEPLVKPARKADFASLLHLPDLKLFYAKTKVLPLDGTKLLDTKTPLKPASTLESKYVLEILYAPGFSNVILKSPLSSFLGSKTATNNRNLRNSISHVGFSYTTGFGLKMNITQDIRIKTGYYFTQVNQTLYYNATPEQSPCNCGKDIALSQLDPNISDANVSERADTIVSGNANSYTNKYSLREIPLIFEFNRPTLKYNNLSYVMNIGLSYMYLSGANVKLVDADNVGFVVAEVSRSRSAFNYLNYKDAFNLIAGGGFMYKARRNVEYTMAPQFKIALTSLSKNDRWLREYPWQMQVVIGVGKRF